jgi:hypothetical protein
VGGGGGGVSYIVKMVSGQPKPPNTWHQLQVMKEILKKNPKFKLGCLPHTSHISLDGGNINDDRVQVSKSYQSKFNKNLGIPAW